MKFSSGKSPIGGWTFTGKVEQNGELEYEITYGVNGSKSYFKGVYDKEKQIIEGNVSLKGSHTRFQLREVKSPMGA